MYTTSQTISFVSGMTVPDIGGTGSKDVLVTCSVSEILKAGTFEWMVGNSAISTTAKEYSIASTGLSNNNQESVLTLTPTAIESFTKAAATKFTCSFTSPETHIKTQSEEFTFTRVGKS